MDPLISLVLAVKNAWPHVRTAVEAICRQTYPNWELIVQDGGSTDGTVEYFSSLDLPRVSVVSAADTGVGQAYNRGLMRATGDLVCFVACDEQLEDDALELAVGWFREHPDAVFVNGAVRLANDRGDVIQLFEPPQFDLLRHLHCEVVLPFAGLLNRKKIGADCFLDAALKTCPDYDFWIRIGSRFGPHEFVTNKAPFKIARADRASMTFRAESFEQFCRDKLFVLNRFLDGQAPSLIVEATRRSASAGIYLWAAGSVLSLEGASPLFLRLCQKAAQFDPWSPRLRKLADETLAFSIDGPNGDFTLRIRVQPDVPPCETTTLARGLSLSGISTAREWKDAVTLFDDHVQVITGRPAWGYASMIPLGPSWAYDPGLWSWARIELQVLSGQIGVSLFAANDVRRERILTEADGRTTVFVRIGRPDAEGLMIRNGGVSQRSSVRIFTTSIETCPIPNPD